MFSYLTESGYAGVYKRVSNRESHFTIDQNEMNSVNMGYHNISADVKIAASSALCLQKFSKSSKNQL